MILLRLLGCGDSALVRALWARTFPAKLAVLLGLAFAVALLAPAAGPATSQLTQLLLIAAALVAVYALVLRPARRR